MLAVASAPTRRISRMKAQSFATTRGKREPVPRRGCQPARLRGLRFKHSSHGCVLFLLVGHGLLQRFHLAVLFEELVEQHRVHRFVAHGVGFALLVTSHEIGIHFRLARPRDRTAGCRQGQAPSCSGR